MRNFILGFLSASLLFGGYLLYERRGQTDVPAETKVEADAGPAEAKRTKRQRKRRRARKGGAATASAQAGGGSEAAEEGEGRQVSEAELRPVTQGDNLSRTEVIDMEKGGEGRELSQAELDGVFGGRRDAILACIDKSRGDAAAHPGRVNVKLRVGRSGAIEGIRVTGPAYMMKAGLHGCVRRALAGLRFPKPSSSLVLTYPFQLR